ncbi:MAG: hypothetical protein A2915_01225 [Candidatus Yanofskybacteria bacterium RIFCSPLOWO2_01_FULL_41_34]|uniref:Cell envelope-related transcriptional attenuator domain-containing protein n=1 Tax=Candidatus Yanofskybacteria bacterium RIFCSPHIGHO2_01_FULL_41_26 TaxID=1802661 RepID=A0A1F8EB72_9BACT|nr:MAG: hypothetical protein A2649_01705 [Candidatus Yanofskybacteria bacterium RIFCSPHIGHO2_01_FULL_41_26]OGN21857.1 MAG: hypothetical protein A2915_01225 [Candidatus Yanofskybacteria bacterium RIFCSPLOWO2_01_FULL_41_34]
MVYLNNQHNFIQADFNERPRFNKKRFSVIILVLVLIIGGYFWEEPVHFWQKMASVFNFISEPIDPDYIMPVQEPDRFDVLVMGLRGEDDPDASDGGPLLTDSIMVLSYDKTTKKVSMISIPRDLYVKIDKNKKNKINTAYEFGHYKKDNGINFTKELVSKITGVYIDKAVILDFSSFEKIIDQVDGIDIILAQPFEESQQWGYKFSLPAGPNHLDGKNALYYARSRFSSSDFDRSRRQQEVVFALKDKLTKLNFWSDPIKTLSILNSIRSNIKTDLNIWNATELLSLSKEISSAEKIKKYTITTDNLLYESRTTGSYILLPQGDNFTQIKQLFQANLN